MRENVKISNIDTKTNKLLKKCFFSKKIANVFYLLDKCLKMKVNKMLGRQTNVYVPTFMYILLFQAYCKHNIRLKSEKP